jgi:integrase
MIQASFLIRVQEIKKVLTSHARREIRRDMKSKSLRVNVPFSSRDFYIFKPQGREDYHIKFTPPPEVREALGIDCVKRTTHHALEAPAREAARQIIEEYFPDKEGKVIALTLAAQRAVGEFELLPEYIERYRRGARTVEDKQSVRQATIEANICNFIKIVETRFDAKGKRTRAVGSWETTRIDAALSPELWNDFKLGWLRGVDSDDRPALDRAKRSVNSIMLTARSLFIDAYLPLYKGLRLPDLKAWRAAWKPYKKSWKTNFVPIGDSTIENLVAEVKGYREDKPDLYLAFFFLIMLGMRRSEVLGARLEWVESFGAAARMAIINRPYYAVKGVEGRVAIAPWLLSEIRELTKARKPLDELILPGACESARDKLIRRLSKMVRRHLGANRTKTLHELRKHACSLACLQVRNYGQALKFSRHADVDTLRDVYDAVLGTDPVIESVTLSGSLRALPDVKEVTA